MKKFILDLISLHLTAAIVIVPSSGFAQVSVSEIGEKPSITPGHNPSYNPSEDENTKLQIPSISDKPTGSPTEGSPQSPDLKNVPLVSPEISFIMTPQKSPRANHPALQNSIC